jgi:ATP-dependent Lhr-like helicase
MYVERGGRGLITLCEPPVLARGATGGAGGDEPDLLHAALGALADAVRAGRVPKLALERIDGEPALACELAPSLLELGFQTSPRRLTLSA